MKCTAIIYVVQYEHPLYMLLPGTGLYKRQCDDTKLIYESSKLWSLMWIKWTLWKSLKHKREEHPPVLMLIFTMLLPKNLQTKIETLQHLTESANRYSNRPQCISIPNRYLICCSFNHWRYLLVFAVIGNSAATCQCHLVVFQINVLLQIGKKINKAVSESAAFDFWKRNHTNRDNASQNL